MINLEVAQFIEKEIRKLPVQDISFGVLDPSQRREFKLVELIKKNISHLSNSEQDRITQEFLGFGPLNNLINDTEITEIIVVDVLSIWFEKEGSLHRLKDQFCSEFTFDGVIDRICQESRAYFNLERPTTNGKFLDFRLHIASQELTKSNHVLCLRRHPKSPWTLNKLFEKNWCTSEQLQMIQKIILERKNFLVVGSTGSGKTSFLNACLMHIKDNERAVLIEDTSELTLPNSISNKLVTRADTNGLLPEINQSELVRQSLRMRPDRLIVGEIRGGEAKDLLMALSTGHEGSFSSMHASSAHQALLRLEMLIQLGASFWSLSAIRNLICLSLHFVIVVEKSPEGQRRLQGIYKIQSLEETGILIDRLL